MVFQSGCDRCRTAAACTGWLPNSLASSSSSPKPSGNGQPIPAATARSRYSWTVPSPIPQLRAIWRCPNPNSNLNRRTSLIFRMDFLLAGTLSSFSDGVSMPGDCPASLHLLLLVCGKHSAPSRTPFRQATKTVRLPTGIGVHLQNGMLFGITTESCSVSERNRVHLRPDSPQAERTGHEAPVIDRTTVGIRQAQPAIPSNVSYRWWSCRAQHELAGQLPRRSAPRQPPNSVELVRTVPQARLCRSGRSSSLG